MSIELPYERQAMQSNIIPPELTGDNVLAFYALRYIYTQYQQKSISREQGAAIKRQILAALEKINDTRKWAGYAADLYKYTELARSAARKNPCAETALALAEAIDGRGWEKLKESE